MSKFRLTLIAAALSAALMSTARAHSEVSEASALSMLPVAVSVAAPSMILVAGAVLTVVSVQASATGTVWVLERASDGARATLHFSGHVAQGAALSVGGAVMVTALRRATCSALRATPSPSSPTRWAVRSCTTSASRDERPSSPDRDLAVTAAATCAHAGPPCETRPAQTNDVVRGMTLAANTAARLDASGAQVVVLARAGQDLSKYGVPGRTSALRTATAKARARLARRAQIEPLRHGQRGAVSPGPRRILSRPAAPL